MWNFRKSEGGKSSFPSRTRASGRRNVWWWVECLFLVSGIALLGVWGVARIDSILSSRTALKELSAPHAPATVASLLDSAAPPQSLDTGEQDFHLWSEARVQAYRKSLTAPAGTPLAVLRIARINLEVPVLEGTDDRTLNHGVGRIPGTARPGEEGNIGIAGHRDSFFRGLKGVRIGDTVELKTVTSTDTYVIETIQIVTPDHVEVLNPGLAPSLTLVTCYPFYMFGNAPQRYIVSASLAHDGDAGKESGVPNSGSPRDRLRATEAPQH